MRRLGAASDSPNQQDAGEEQYPEVQRNIQSQVGWCLSRRRPAKDGGEHQPRSCISGAPVSLCILIWVELCRPSYRMNFGWARRTANSARCRAFSARALATTLTDSSIRARVSASILSIRFGDRDRRAGRWHAYQSLSALVRWPPGLAGRSGKLVSRYADQARESRRLSRTAIRRQDAQTRPLYLQ